jgi:HK97 family phage prohead protease
MQKGLIKSNIVDLDDRSGIVTVAANAFGNIDSDRDISMPGSFSKTIKENFHRLKWFLNHDRTQLLGVPLEAKETSEYLQVRGQINLKKQIGRDTYEDYKLYAENGLSLEHSIGVDAIKYIEDRENDVRKVTEWKWWEYSTLTSWGANERTPMIEMKGMDNILPDLAFLELKMKKGNYRDETFIGIEKAIANIKSLLMQEEVLHQPVPIDVLTDVSQSFLKLLKSN